MSQDRRQFLTAALAAAPMFVPRSAWDDTMLSEGQRVELVAAMQGG